MRATEQYFAVVLSNCLFFKVTSLDNNLMNYNNVIFLDNPITLHLFRRRSVKTSSGGALNRSEHESVTEF